MDYYFSGKDKLNNRIKGHYQGLSKEEVIEDLYKQNIYVNRIYRDFKLIKQQKIKDAALIAFMEEWYSLELAKINTQQIIEIIKNNTTNQALKSILQLIILDLNSGIKLSDAFLKHQDFFPELFLKIIDIGFQRGNLKDSLLMLIDYYKEQNDINGKMQSALIYPKILAVVFILAFIVVCKLIVPSFYNMFKESNVELNKFTSIIFDVLLFVGNNLLWIAIMIISLFLIYQLLKNTVFIKKNIDSLKLKFQKKKLTYYYSYLFTRIMCLLWSSGVGKIESINYVSSIIPNYLYKKKLYDVQKEISEGMLYGKSLENHQLFDQTLCKMLIVGESSNFLEKNMANAAKYYHYRYTIILNKLVKLIEPLLIIIMAFFIGFIVIIIFIPMLNAFKMVM